MAVPSAYTVRATDRRHAAHERRHATPRRAPRPPTYHRRPTATRAVLQRLPRGGGGALRQVVIPLDVPRQGRPDDWIRFGVHTSPRSERALVDRPALASRAPPPTGSRCRFPSSGTSQAPRDGPLSTGGKYARRPHYPILAGLTRSCRWAYPARDVASCAVP